MVNINPAQVRSMLSQKGINNPEKEVVKDLVKQLNEKGIAVKTFGDTTITLTKEDSGTIKVNIQEARITNLDKLKNADTGGTNVGRGKVDYGPKPPPDDKGDQTPPAKTKGEGTEAAESSSDILPKPKLKGSSYKLHNHYDKGREIGLTMSEIKKGGNIDTSYNELRNSDTFVIGPDGKPTNTTHKEMFDKFRDEIADRLVKEEGYDPADAKKAAEGIMKDNVIAYNCYVRKYEGKFQNNYNDNKEFDQHGIKNLKFGLPSFSVEDPSESNNNTVDAKVDSYNVKPGSTIIVPYTMIDGKPTIKMVTSGEVPINVKSGYDPKANIIGTPNHGSYVQGMDTVPQAFGEDFPYDKAVDENGTPMKPRVMEPETHDKQVDRVAQYNVTYDANGEPTIRIMIHSVEAQKGGKTPNAHDGTITYYLTGDDAKEYLATHTFKDSNVEGTGRTDTGFKKIEEGEYSATEIYFRCETKHIAGAMEMAGQNTAYIKVGGPEKLDAIANRLESLMTYVNEEAPEAVNAVKDKLADYTGKKEYASTADPDKQYTPKTFSGPGAQTVSQGYENAYEALVQ